MNCPLCGLSSKKFKETKSECTHNTSFVAEVTINEVKAAIHDLLHIEKEVLAEASI